MGPRRPKVPEKKVEKEEEKMTFQEKLLFNLVEGLQQQREYDLKRKNEDLLERIERLEKGKEAEQKSQGFMTHDPSNSQLKDLSAQINKMSQLLENPYRAPPPWMSGAQPSGFQNPNQFQQPAQTRFEQPQFQAPAEREVRPKKVKYRASTPPPDDSDEDRLKNVEKRRIEKAIKRNDRVADKMLKDFDLPSDVESDGSFQEKLKRVDELSKEQKEKERLKKKQKYDEIVEAFDRRQEEKKTKVRKSDKIKAIFKSFIQLLMLLFRARKRIQERISRNQSLLADGIRIYTEVLKNVLLQWLKTPIISVIMDNKVNFNLKTHDGVFGTSKKNLEKRFIQLKVRMKSIMNILFEKTNTFNLSRPILLFLSQLIAQGAYIPQDFLNDYEKSKLDFDNLGALRYSSQAHGEMILGMLFISKTLVKHLMLNPQGSGINLKMKEQGKKNLKILGSVLHYIIFTAIQDRMPGSRKAKDIEDDGISDLLTPVEDLVYIFVQNSPWALEMSKLAGEWLEQLYMVVETHRENEKKREEGIEEALNTEENPFADD